MSRRAYHLHEVVYRRLEAEGHTCWDKTAFGDFTMRPFLERALERIGSPQPGARALDVGCGTGPVAAVLHERGYLTTGIDVSETAVRLARQQVPGAQFAVQDALTMPGAECFELVVDSHCLHCIVRDEHRRAFLSTLHRLLVPGGQLIVDTMVNHRGVRFDDPHFWLDQAGTLWRELPAELMSDDQKSIGERQMTPQRRILDAEAVRAEVREAGFVITSDLLRAQEVPEEPWALELTAQRVS